MIRSITCAAAAILLTTGAVAAMAENFDQPKVTIDHKTGAYCVSSGVFTGSRIPQRECRSVGDWAKDGVTFSRR